MHKRKYKIDSSKHEIIQKSNEKKLTISEEKILNNKVIKNKITLKNDDIDQNSNNKIDQNFIKKASFLNLEMKDYFKEEM